MNECASKCCGLTFTIEQPKEITFVIDTEVTVIDHDPYEGEYVVIPKRRDIVLDTRNKTMRDDVTVKEVPYAETSNQYGTTYIIAAN